MKRNIGRLAALVSAGAALCLSAASGAWASDIACKAAARESPVRCVNPDGSGVRCALATEESRPPAQQRHLVCDSSRLTERYERIYAEQQRMLHKGRIQDSDIAAWRARRDGCNSARCLESLFAKFWRERDSMRSPPARPARPADMPAAAAAMPPQAITEPPPATVLAEAAAETPAPAQPPQEAPPPAELLALQAAPPPAEPAQPAAPFLESLPEWQSTVLPAEESMSSTPARSALAMESLLSGLAVLGVGAGLLWTRRGAGAQLPPHFSFPAALVIVFGLLLVNALLLPFTLGS